MKINSFNFLKKNSKFYKNNLRKCSEIFKNLLNKKENIFEIVNLLIPIFNVLLISLANNTAAELMQESAVDIANEAIPIIINPLSPEKA